MPFFCCILYDNEMLWTILIRLFIFSSRFLWHHDREKKLVRCDLTDLYRKARYFYLSYTLYVFSYIKYFIYYIVRYLVSEVFGYIELQKCYYLTLTYVCLTDVRRCRYEKALLCTYLLDCLQLFCHLSWNIWWQLIIQCSVIIKSRNSFET